MKWRFLKPKKWLTLSVCHAGMLEDNRTPVGSGSIIYSSSKYYWNICSFASNSPSFTCYLFSAFSTCAGYLAHPFAK